MCPPNTPIAPNSQGTLNNQMASANQVVTDNQVASIDRVATARSSSSRSSASTTNYQDTNNYSQQQRLCPPNTPIASNNQVVTDNQVASINPMATAGSSSSRAESGPLLTAASSAPVDRNPRPERWDLWKAKVRDNNFTLRRIAETRRYSAEQEANRSKEDSTGTHSLSSEATSGADLSPNMPSLAVSSEADLLGVTISIPETIGDNTDVVRLLNAHLADPDEIIDLDDYDDAVVHDMWADKTDLNQYELEVDIQMVSGYQFSLSIFREVGFRFVSQNDTTQQLVCVFYVKNRMVFALNSNFATFCLSLKHVILDVFLFFSLYLSIYLSIY